MCNWVGWKICSLSVLTVIAFGQSAWGEAPTAPFVAGFDRFARHDEIDRKIGGELLLSELSCTACHVTKVERLQPKRGPRLDGVADRVGGGWIEQFLSSPSTTKPGTTMPDILVGLTKSKKAHTVKALAAFLSTQHESFPVLKAGGGTPVPFEFWKKGDVKQGKQLYHQVGCVACHAADDNYEVAAIKPSPIDEALKQLDPKEIVELGLAAKARKVNSVPHAELPVKYTKRSLTFFLLNPESVRPSGRMPSLTLTPIEAADIATYLLRNQQTSPLEQAATVEAALIQEGKRLFGELHCANCHSAADVKANETAKPWAGLNGSSDRSCFATPRKGLPHFELDDAQRLAIQAVLADSVDEKNPSPVHNLQSQMLRLNCYACHERDKQGGVGRYRKPYLETVGHVDIGDEGRLPPPLTGVGRKLRATWLKKVFEGSGAVRPHMRIRMPKFPQTMVASLPNVLIDADGTGKQPTEKDVFGDRRKLAEAGRALMNFGCVECHQFRGETLPGSVGVDLKGVTDRIQPQWFRDFLLNPEQLKTRTRMPTFFPNGESQNKELLEGHTERQIAAMWTYLKEIDKHPLPEKIVQARKQDFELIPKDRPILLRTFMKKSGTHAIAVGFPSGVHFALDAEQVHLAQAWRGRFLDAQGTWFVRAAPPAEPLGKPLINMPPGPSLALLQDKRQAWPSGDAGKNGTRFSGYRLDAAGVPTFLYRYQQFDIEDRIEPNKNGGLTRQLTITTRKPVKKTPTLWLQANIGKTLRRDDASTYTNDSGLTVTLSDAVGRRGEIRKKNDTAEWIIPLQAAGEITIEVQYKW